MTKDDYAAKVSDFAEREENARLFLAWRAADDALKKAQLEDDDTTTPGLDDLYIQYRGKMREIDLWYDAERARIKGTSPSGALELAAETARRAYSEAPGGPISEDDEGGVMRCDLSGAALIDDDETIEIGGHTILACLFVPADVLAELRGEAEEDEIEEAA